MQLLLDKSLLFCSHDFQMLHMNHVVALGSLSMDLDGRKKPTYATSSLGSIHNRKTALLGASVATKSQNVHVTLTMRLAALPIKMPHFACAENREV